MVSSGKAWYINQANQTAGPDSLEQRDYKVPELGTLEVLIRVQAVSLNYRDLGIVNGTYPRPADKTLIQGSDAAGEIVAIGSSVRTYAIGDKVSTCFFRDYTGGDIDYNFRNSALGSEVDGAFRQYIVASTQSMVHIPKSLSVREASTLPCAALTAWNCLYGDKPLRLGDSVVIQGTGGVSLFGLQFAVAAGAKVIATTSSKSKEAMLYKMGASHVINYRDTPEWGDAVRKIVPEGVDYILDIGGVPTIRESIKAIKLHGMVCLIGSVAGKDVKGGLSVWEARIASAIMRPVYVGKRSEFVEMNRAIDSAGIKPIVDEKKFGFDDMVDAYRHMAEAKHIGNIVVDV